MENDTIIILVCRSKFQVTFYQVAARTLASILPLILLCVLISPSPVRADIAPPESPPGANLVPGTESTQVRMVSEIVTLDVKEKSAGRWLGQAKVTAEFQMRNLGSAEERMEVRFPLTFWNGFSDGFGEYLEISDLTVEVDGRKVSTLRISTPAQTQPTTTLSPGRRFQ